MFGEESRKNKYYLKFAEENKKETESLCKDVEESKEKHIPIQTFFSRFYEVYKKMRSYGASDRDLAC